MKLKNSRTLVTGAAGFIGSHLVECLLQQGTHVRAFVRYNSTSEWGWLDHLPADAQREIEVFPGDIRDAGTVEQAFRDIDVVFHLAALIGIPYSYTAPSSYVETNVKGTLNVLEAAKNGRIDRLIVTSTSEVYGTARYVPIDEQHPLQPQSPYSATKIAADCLAESYHRAFDLPVTIARPFNTYGPRQSARAIIPTIITQLIGGGGELILGSVHPTRDFNYVNDTVAGFIALAECDEALGQVVNIGSGTETSVLALVELIIKQLAVTAEIKEDQSRQRPPNSEVDRLLSDNSLIKRMCGWEPKVSLEEGIRRTTAWFSDPQNLKKYKATKYNV